MDREKRLDRTWLALQHLLHGFICRRFNLQAEPFDYDGACLVISNHVATWDPLLLAMSFPKKRLRFVASEHIFRLGFVSGLISALVEPISRRKASMGTDTVMQSMRALKAGVSVCIFAEGDATWDGVSKKVFPATGKLARASGASLVTYRLEGGYLSLPRWSRRLRRGRTRGHVVGVYSPEQLRTMQPEEIDDVINRDIYENAWQRQRAEHIEFRARRLAEHIEQGLFLCPRCARADGIKGVGDRVTCTCGLSITYTPEGFFEPPEPFESFYEWDRWQFASLKDGSYQHGEELFSDGDIKLREIGAKHGQRLLCTGRLSQREDALSICGRAIRLSDISSMAMVKANTLLLTVEGKYYELRAAKPCCLRKYLAVWENARACMKNTDSSTATQ